MSKNGGGLPRRRSTLSHSATAAQLAGVRDAAAKSDARPTAQPLRPLALSRSATLAMPRAKSGTRVTSGLARVSATHTAGGSLDERRKKTEVDVKRVGGSVGASTPRGEGKAGEGNAECIVHELLAKRLLDKLASLARQRRVDLRSLQLAATKRTRDEFIELLIAPLNTRRVTLVHELVRYCTPDTVLWLLQFYARLFERREVDSRMLPSHAAACARDDHDSAPMLEFWRTLPLPLLLKEDGERVTVAQYLALKRSNTAVRIVVARLGDDKDAHTAVTSSQQLLLDRTTSELRKERAENRRLAHNSEAAEQNAEELRSMHARLNEAIEERDEQLSALRAQLDSVNGECASLRERCTSLTREAHEQREQLAAARTAAQRAEQRAREAQEDVQAVTEQLDNVERRARELGAERATLVERLADMEQQLAQAPDADAVRRIEAEREQLESNALAKVDAAIRFNERERSDLREQCELARRDERRLREQLDKSTRAYHEARAEASVLRERTQMLHAQLAAQSAQLTQMQSTAAADESAAPVVESQPPKSTVPSLQLPERAPHDDPVVDDDGSATCRHNKRRAESKRLREELKAKERELGQLRQQLQESIVQSAPTPRSTTSSPQHTPRAPIDVERGPASVAVGSSSMAVLRNRQLNESFYARLFTAVRTGNAALLAQFLDLGISPNTRDDGAQPLLEIGVRAALELHNSQNVFTPKELHAHTVALNKTLRLLIERGGDWQHLDAFLRTHGGNSSSGSGADGGSGGTSPRRARKQLPRDTARLLASRDDFSPFCLALLANDSERANEYVECVETFDRVPSRYRRECYTYLHIAVVNGDALLVQRMVLSGRADVNRVDSKDRAPLHLAIQKCADARARELIVQYLLAGGAYPALPCNHVPLLRRTRDALRKRAAKKGSNGMPLTLLGNHRQRSAVGGAVSKTSASALEKEIVSRSYEALQYGTPEALARAVGADDVVEMLRSRRYLRLTCSKRDAEEHGLPLLQEYVGTWVALHTLMRRLLECGRVTRDDGIYTIFERYCDVFACFNSNYRGNALAGYDESVLAPIYAAAGIDDRHACSDDDRRAALRKLVDRDEVLIMNTMTSSGAHGGDAKTNANANHLWQLCKMLMQCTKAVSERWFEVSDLIRSATAALYERASAEALRAFVCDGALDELDWMLSRAADLFVPLDVNSVIDEKQQMTPIQLAAHVGVTHVLEYLMERQRQRIDGTDARGRTLLTIALAASQPISVLCIDFFKHRAGLSSERHANQCHYGLLHRETENSVLHQCARCGRDDLIEFCLPLVRYQTSLRNANKETPVDVAQVMLKMHSGNEKLAPHYEKCVELLSHD